MQPPRGSAQVEQVVRRHERPDLAPEAQQHAQRARVPGPPAHRRPPDNTVDVTGADKVDREEASDDGTSAREEGVERQRARAAARLRARVHGGGRLVHQGSARDGGQGPRGRAGAPPPDGAHAHVQPAPAHAGAAGPGRVPRGGDPAADLRRRRRCSAAAAGPSDGRCRGAGWRVEAPHAGRVRAVREPVRGLCVVPRVCGLVCQPDRDRVEAVPRSGVAVQFVAGQLFDLDASLQDDREDARAGYQGRARFSHKAAAAPALGPGGLGLPLQEQPELRVEGVTYSGALTAAVILAYYHASQKHHTVELTDNFKVTLTMSTNLRTRLPTPVPEDVVGSFASLVPLDSVKGPGTVLASAKFWDVARTCKQDIKNGLKSPTVAFTDIFMDQNFNSASVPTAFAKHVVKNSCTGDVNISNIGRYPYPMAHSLGDTGELSVEALFLYESVPFFSMGTLMYVSTVKSFNYAMLHKYEDSDAERLFKAYVAFAEHIGEVDPNATMADVLVQVGSSLK
ncbi:hypothetical protein ON010_g13499 [Phytophthora cinnamomi]|nr:hypothetical protein ON010_g13499 [Phytophthora cinnamomi]